MQIAIERNKEGHIVATVEHAKDSESGAIIASRLERVELGDDDEGDPMTSCVIVPAETVPKGPKLTVVQRFALELLERLVQTNSVEPPADAALPKGSRVVLGRHVAGGIPRQLPVGEPGLAQADVQQGSPGICREAPRHLLAGIRLAGLTVLCRFFLSPGKIGVNGSGQTVRDLVYRDSGTTPYAL